MSKKKKSTKAGGDVKVVAIAGTLVAVAAFMFVWKPQSAALSSAKHDRVSVEEELAVAQGETVVAEPTGEPPTPAEVTSNAAVPGSPELSRLLRQLDGIAKEAGMEQSAISPSPLAANPLGSGGVVQLSITATGARDGAYAYLAKLATLERVVVVEQVSMSASPDATLQLQLTAKAFSTQRPAGTTEGA